jgi:hypothetical protein
VTAAGSPLIGSCRWAETGPGREDAAVEAYRLPSPGSPVCDLTSSCAAVFAGTIMRTVELGVTITDAAVDGDTTVLSCGLLTRVGRHARAVEARNLPRHRHPPNHRRARGRPPSAAAGPDAALSLYNDQLSSRSIRPQH